MKQESLRNYANKALDIAEQYKLNAWLTKRGL